jgi:2-iminobutanoate/2-iminopropanoate deaminase
LRLYLSVPMIANRSTSVASTMAKAIGDSGHEVTSPWVLGPIEPLDHKTLNIFERDRRGAEESDAIVADVSSPSIGVGMELMAAYKAGKKVIVVFREGSTVSRMLLHMQGLQSLEFKDEEDLYSKLTRMLALLKPYSPGAVSKNNSPDGGASVKREIVTAAAPIPVGPYAQAIEESGTFFCSGQIGLNSATGMLEPGMAGQTRKTLENLAEVLKAAGLGLDDVVRTTVYLADMTMYAQMNEEYSKHFKPPFPARTTIQAAPPRGALVEIDAIARARSPKTP